MPNQITLPQGIQTILDEVYRQASVTSVLDQPGHPSCDRRRTCTSSATRR